MQLKLVPIPPKDVTESYPVWGEFIDRIAERMQDRPENLIEKILAGQIHIIIAWDAENRKAEALCGVRVVLHGEGRMAEVVWLTGKGRERWTPLFPDLEKYFLEHLGCNRAKLEFRPGWKPTVEAHGYKITHMVAEKELT